VYIHSVVPVIKSRKQDWLSSLQLSKSWQWQANLRNESKKTASIGLLDGAVSVRCLKIPTRGAPGSIEGDDPVMAWVQIGCRLLSWVKLALVVPMVVAAVLTVFVVMMVVLGDIGFLFLIQELLIVFVQLNNLGARVSALHI
jgi:hypothetical protein